MFPLVLSCHSTLFLSRREVDTPSILSSLPTSGLLRRREGREPTKSTLWIRTILLRLVNSLKGKTFRVSLAGMSWIEMIGCQSKGWVHLLNCYQCYVVHVC